MKKKHYATLLITTSTLLLGGCQPRIFGLDETVWNSLNEQEREKVIDGYNKRKEIELLNQHKQREKELENERHRQEVEAQTAPIYAAAGAASSIWGNTKSRFKCGTSICIESISSTNGKRILTIGNEHFEVSAFTKISQAWVKGQKVVLTQNDDDLLYPVKIKNIDNGESVKARKSRRT